MSRRFYIIALYYLPFLFLCGVIYWLSSMSHPPIPRMMRFASSDKILHAMAFFGVGAAAAFGAVLRRRRVNLAAYLEAWILTLIYAALDEFHQVFTPLRTPDSADWLADAFGSALGITLFLVLVRWYLKRRQ